MLKSYGRQLCLPFGCVGLILGDPLLRLIEVECDPGSDDGRYDSCDWRRKIVKELVNVHRPKIWHPNLAPDTLARPGTKRGGSSRLERGSPRKTLLVGSRRIERHAESHIQPHSATRDRSAPAAPFPPRLLRPPGGLGGWLCCPARCSRRPGGLRAADLDTLAEAAWAVFPSLAGVPWHEIRLRVESITLAALQAPALAYALRASHSLNFDHRRRARDRGVVIDWRERCLVPGPPNG